MLIQAYSVERIRQAEAAAQARTGDGVLMRRAATALAQVVVARLTARLGSRPGSRLPGRSVVLLVGTGDNGGDALIAGALLRGRGLAVTAVLTDPARAHADGLARLRRAWGRVVTADDPRVAGLLAGADVVIDGLVGLAARPPLREPAASLVRLAVDSPALTVAVDLPSGLHPDTGVVSGPVFRADVTVTFGALKPGLLLADEWCGTVVSDDLGMGVGTAPGTSVRADLLALTDGAAAALLPDPGRADDKYTGGLVGVAAGSTDYPGAPVLSVGGAVCLRPGMVRYAGAQAKAVVARWPEVVAAESVERAGRVQAWVVGPGMGTDETAAATLRTVLEQDVPVLVDADGLTLLAGHRDWLDRRRAAGQVTVLTPHDREFTRVFGDLDLTDRLDAVRRAAATSGAVVLLKGHRTLVAAPDGTTWVNLTGTPWLASAGSGDVLSGVIGSLLASGLPADRAAALGAHLHGRAGERAERAGRAGAHALWEFLRG
ncbi:NAD(P)H-hydrate dehydratase [Nakamurella leprariae]|uniref:Bifunctional NAD(P)H-hydrate repair enzyme n=1 Tax=Nakamurella leprariae TaxID=2803911 RepID=A0A938YFR6_9ACTN|nr:NAD(P)H-hydrate dehydratase [Nakamurella leprariae]MBM9467572.1 NAD(P)H-hydrate dehydratase [Nakamurella leprariae]